MPKPGPMCRAGRFAACAGAGHGRERTGDFACRHQASNRPLSVRSGRAAIPRLAVLLPLVGWAVATTLPLIPDPLCLAFRDFGLGTAATVGLWAWGTAVAVRGRD